MNDLVSIITTAYNAEKYIKNTIESVLDQEYQNFEYIIVDDGSTDRTAQIVQLFSDTRIKFIQEEHIGRGRSLNKGIEASKGKYIAIQDADDLSHPKRLSIQVYCLKKMNDSGLLGTSQIEFFENQIPQWQILEGRNLQKSVVDSKWGLLYFNPISHTSMMVPRAIMNNVGNYDQTRIHLFDWDLYLRICADGYRVCQVPLPLVGKRIHKKQFFERRNRISYIYGSMKLQIRGAFLLKRFGLPLISIPFLFVFRLLPVKFRIGVRPLLKSVFHK